MLLTDIRISFDATNGGLLGAACLTFDGVFAVKEVKIIRDKAGLHFLEFPGRPIVGQCPACRRPNGLAACFCSRCGTALDPERDVDKLVSVAHPIDGEFRTYCTDAVLAEYVRLTEKRGGH